MNINHSYNASKLQNDISNMALVSTTFVNTWNNLTGERFSQDSRDLAKAGRDLYQQAETYINMQKNILRLPTRLLKIPIHSNLKGLQRT